MKLFKKAGAIRGEVGQLRTNEKLRREDRATVSNFFHGAPPLTQQEAEDLGFTVNVNHLFGYKDLSDASDQVFGLYTKPATLVDISLEAAPPGKGSHWGMIAAREASRVFRKITAFKSAYQGISGDAAMHGEALFFYPNKTFPLPKQCPLSRMLIPDDASCDVKELSHFAIERFITVAELRFYWEKGTKGWNRQNIGRVLKRIYEGCGTDGQPLDPNNLEEAEYRRQENSNSSTNTSRRPGVEVVYFYQQRVDKPGMPYDLSICLMGEDESPGKENSMLYEYDSAIDDITHCLHPFFMDCIIGGAPKWHRVLGTGTLNYQINHAVELLVNRAQQSTGEANMNLWQARDTATRDAAQQILMKHNGIIPEGLNLVQNSFAPNLAGTLEMIQFFRQAGSKNSRGITPNNGDSNDMLEVQAIAEMNQGAAGVNNRMSNLYDYLDGMWSEAVRRLADPCIDEKCPGYSEAMDFQAAVQRQGVDLYYLQQPNIQVRAIRIIGDGARHKELGAVQYLTANRNQYAPEVQPQITRLCTGLALDNYRLAEELTPVTEEETESPQLLRVDSENAIMLTMRKELKAKVDDIDEIHVTGHFPALEGMLTDALQYQNGAFVPQQAQAFLIIGGHIKLHIDRIEARALNNRNDPERDKARAFMEQLNQLAAMGQKLMNQMQQAQEGQQQEPMSEAERAKLMLEVEKATLAREKFELAREKFQRTQGTKEQKMAFDQNLALNDARMRELADKRDAIYRDIDSAVKVASLQNKPSNGSR